jgi:disulfide oxidoreductase YuzD
MEPISLIIAALGAGAIAAAKDTATTAVKDTYQGLKALIKKKFEGDVLGQAMVDAKPEEIKQAEGLLKDKITKAGADRDAAIIQAAQELLNQVKEQPGGQQIITQNISNVKYAATSGSGNASISGINEQGTSKED